MSKFLIIFRIKKSLFSFFKARDTKRMAYMSKTRDVSTDDVRLSSTEKEELDSIYAVRGLQIKK